MPLYFVPGLTINKVDYDFDQPTPDLAAADNRLGTVYASGSDVLGNVVARGTMPLQAYDEQGQLSCQIGPRSGTDQGSALFNYAANLTLYSSATNGRLGVNLLGSDQTFLIAQDSGNSWIAGSYDPFFLINASGRIAVGHEDPLELVDVAGNISLRNDLTPTEILLHGAYTDSLNYELLNIKATGTEYHLSSEAAGTGVVRNIKIPAGDLIGGTGVLTWPDRGNHQIGDLNIGYAGSGNPALSGGSGSIRFYSILSLRNDVVAPASHSNDLVFTHQRSGDYGLLFQTTTSGGVATNRFRIGGGDTPAIYARSTSFDVIGADGGPGQLRIAQTNGSLDASITNSGNSLNFNAGTLRFQCSNIGSSNNIQWPLGNREFRIRTSGSQSFVVEGSSIATVPMYVIGGASQTANLQDWRNSDVSANAFVDVECGVTATGLSLQNGLTSTESSLYATITGDTDYERIRTYFDGTNSWCIANEATGTGSTTHRLKLINYLTLINSQRGLVVDPDPHNGETLAVNFYSDSCLIKRAHDTEANYGQIKVNRGNVRIDGHDGTNTCWLSVDAQYVRSSGAFGFFNTNPPTSQPSKIVSPDGTSADNKRAIDELISLVESYGQAAVV